MTFVEVLLLMQGTGVAGIGVGILKWAMGVEKRITRIETVLQLKG